MKDLRGPDSIIIPLLVTSLTTPSKISPLKGLNTKALNTTL